MNMTLEGAIKKAEKFTGESFTQGGYMEYWRVVMARLLEEVKKNDNPAAQDFTAEMAAHDAEVEALQSPGPLPALLLADMIDSQAEELADIAKEIDIYNGLKHEGAVKSLGTFKSYLVLFAKQLREESKGA